MHANFKKAYKAIPPDQNGFTLIEVLVAMVLGLIIIGGAFSYFLSTLKTSKAMLAQSQLQQEIRASADLMQRDLRRAGYKPNGSTVDVGTIYLGKTDAALTADNCVIYSYVNENGAIRTSGFLTQNDKLYMYTKSTTPTTTCPASTNTNWSAMTLGSTNKIAVFEPSVEDNPSNFRPLLRITLLGCLEIDKSVAPFKCKSTSPAINLSEQIILQNSPSTVSIP